MCGIFGISYTKQGAGVEEWETADLLQIMFPAIVHRGRHAYGWMSYSDERGLEVYKWEGRCDTPEAMANMELVDPDPLWLVAHVRAATHGDPRYMNNNHPIIHGDIVGVHNGVISNYSDILKITGREDPYTEVDSEAIFAAINHWGHKRGLARIEGSMVTVYVNRKHPRTVHMARTSGRPLAMTKTKAGALIFASEEEVIDATAITHGDWMVMGNNRLLRVRRGKVKERITYRVDPPRKPKYFTRSALGEMSSPVRSGETYKQWVERQWAEVEGNMRRSMEKDK